MKTKRNLYFILAVFIIGIIGGAFAYHRVEGWNLLDSLYFVVVTVTTIGYGDLVPKTTIGKVFTMFYAFFGVAVAVYLLSAISSSVFKRHIVKHVKKQNNIKEK